jgi:anti-sigma factor RsiW
MNCRSFQNELYEYVEGSLSADAQAAAERHLAGCSACRHAVRQEQVLAQAVSSRLRLHAKTLALRPEIRNRILAAGQVKTPPPVLETLRGLWDRFFRLAAIPACLMVIVALLLAGHFPVLRTGGTKTASLMGSAQPDTVSMQVSYRVPAYQFHREGAQVIDSLSEETIAVSGVFYADGKRPAIPNPERKKPL